MPLQKFQYKADQLHCEEVLLETIAATAGTPVYVYSSAAIRENFDAYKRSLEGIPYEIHYAVKANSSLAVLALLASEGAGFDIVSGGELFRVLRARGDPAKIVYSGVGKTREEMEFALRERIGVFHCESVQELDVLRDAARQMGVAPTVGLRVNPNIDARTHPYIATGLSEHKFGIALEDAESIYGNARQWAPLQFRSLSCHIGSQVFDTQVFDEALHQLLGLATRLSGAGIAIRSIDLGGGLGVGYLAGQPSVPIQSFGQMLKDAIRGTGFRLGLEPGRSIIGQAGALLTQVLYRKPAGTKTFVVVDGAMNDLLRPALYQAHHEIIPVSRSNGPSIECDVVGPVCETGDFLATARSLPHCSAGDLLAVATAGAYGFVQSSNYNSRPRAAEVLVERDRFRIVRDRETHEDLVRGETA